MNLFELLNRLAAEQDLPFLLIGGLAVNLYGYSRHTHDIDLLIRKNQREDWERLLHSLGYEIYRDEANFLQLNPTKASAAWPLDLMLVNEETFAKMAATSEVLSQSGSPVKVPSVEHLIALKLHVLKQNISHRTIKDFLDIQALVEHQKVDLRSETMKEIFARYGTDVVYHQILVACGQE